MSAIKRIEKLRIGSKSSQKHMFIIVAAAQE
jgi:hypothetical protein